MHFLVAWLVLLLSLFACKTTSSDRRGRALAPQVNEPREEKPPAEAAVNPETPPPAVDTVMTTQTTAEQKKADVPVLPPAPMELAKECQGKPSTVNDVPNVAAIFILSPVDLTIVAACPYLNATVVLGSALSGDLELGKGFKDIRGSLIVRKTLITNLKASSLEKIGGSFILEGNKALADVTMPLLTRVSGGLQVGGYADAGNGTLSRLNVPVLTTVGGSFRVFNMAQAFDLSGLVLTSAGGFWVRDLHQQPTLEIPLVTRIGELLIEDSPEIDRISFPKLEYLEGDFVIRSTLALPATKLQEPKTVSLPALNLSRYSMRFQLDRPCSFDFRSLTSVTSNLFFVKSGLRSDIARMPIVDLKLQKLAYVIGSLGFSEVELPVDQILDLPVLAIANSIQLQGASVPLSMPKIDQVSQFLIRSYDATTKQFCLDTQAKVKFSATIDLPQAIRFYTLNLCNVEGLKTVSIAQNKVTDGLLRSIGNPDLESITLGTHAAMFAVELKNNPKLATFAFTSIPRIGNSATKLEVLTIQQNPLLSCELIKNLQSKVDLKAYTMSYDGICREP